MISLNTIYSISVIFFHSQIIWKRVRYFEGVWNYLTTSGWYQNFPWENSFSTPEKKKEYFACYCWHIKNCTRKVFHLTVYIYWKQRASTISQLSPIITCYNYIKKLQRVIPSRISLFNIVLNCLTSYETTW